MDYLNAAITDIDQLIVLWEKQVNFHLNLDPEYYAPYGKKYTLADDRQYLLGTISKKNPGIVIAKDGETIVGFIFFKSVQDKPYDTLIEKYGEISEFYVDENYRRQGIGTQLIKEAESRITALGLKYCKIQVSALNHQAINLYEKSGYIDRQHLMFKQL